MLKRFCIVLCFVLFIPFVVYGAEPSVSARSSVSLDLETGTVLYDKNAYQECSMASTTKIMTCLIACESNKLDDIVEITQEMLDGAIGSLIYLKAGDKISLYDLVVGAMLASGNDAANSIAVYIGDSVTSFVDLMNEKAIQIGMKNTEFVTPSGLDDGNHHSTAYDMAILASYALKNNYFKDICTLKSANITINGKEQTVYNHNKLLSYDDNFVGVKTGFTEKAGRCLISAYNHCGNIIIIVTLNAPDDWDDHKKILDYSIEKYKEYRDIKLIDLDVVGGNLDKVKCECEYTATTLGDVKTRLYYYPFTYAPVKAGDVVGRLDIIANEKVIMTVEIIAKEDVEIWQEITK